MHIYIMLYYNFVTYFNSHLYNATMKFHDYQVLYLTILNYDICKWNSS